ncbi:MAG: DUF2946 domain-containing protein [Bradyrhizobium sp.]|uniref:DUF2946 domain-containing protein n=1 Tax=Bradyrhizobium sp. TaxID=376 RepID=UPI001D867C9F|nr:DUF2946 domain-containing protein [Bradyrhizobium sp.]MBV9564009.1 DUF2946 domain-containing protein [Bradyrhizobium sp.]
MRRLFQRFFPIVLIALMVQILAPIGACWAAALAASDPLQLAEICHSDPAAAAGQTDRGDHHLHDGACSICCAGQGGASLDTPQVVVVAAPPRQAARVVWCDTAQDRSPPRIGSNTQARAPPLSI